MGQDDVLAKLTNHLQSRFDFLLNEAVKKLKADSFKKASQRDKNVGQQDFDKGCDQLYELVKGKFESDIAKFELYSRRNLFSNYVAIQNQNPSPTKRSKSSSNTNSDSYSIINSHSSGLDLEKSKQRTEELEKLQQLSNNYLDWQKRYQDAAVQKSEAERLSDAVNKAMFNIRVAMQSFEQDPLENSLLLIQENTQTLAALRRNANYTMIKLQELTANAATMNESGAINSSGKQQHQPLPLPDVIMGQGNDVNKMTSSIRQGF